MASVSSLDKDLRNLRLSKYTPQAANEVRGWIEESLKEKLPDGDLLDVLKDGVALCRLVNLAAPEAGVRFKQSPMPFVQMENISHFLRAMQNPPFGLHQHDVFLTVDLYERKDPAQVLQCLGSFSRRANDLNPSSFTSTIGPKGRGSTMSPQSTGKSNGGYTKSPAAAFNRARGSSSASQSPAPATKERSPQRPAGGLSSWSKNKDEGVTTPAWNISQYGYLGGASQGNQGISFGGRRQITSAAPKVPSFAEKEQRRKEEAAEQERLRVQAEEAETKRRVEREAEEERERAAEERRWEEETQKQLEKERQEAEEERKRWQEQERQWQQEEQKRIAEEREAEARLKIERDAKNSVNDAQLQGQFLSQYQADQRKNEQVKLSQAEKPAESDRIRQLESELAEAREREKRYQQEREQRPTEEPEPESIVQPQTPSHFRPRTSEVSPPSQSPDEGKFGSAKSLDQEEERQQLRGQWNQYQNGNSPEVEHASPSAPGPTRPLPDPNDFQSQPELPKSPSRPLPDPGSYASRSNRTEQFLASNPAPAEDRPQTYFSNELGFDSNVERHAETARRETSQSTTKAGGWASKSLLEREMELERQRQQDWEESQKATAEAARQGVGKGLPEGSIGEGGSWDVNQYGWTGGDNQNKGGVGFGGRRQIIGPRPPPPR